MINAIRLFKVVGIDKIKSILAEEGLEHFKAHLDGDDWKTPSIVTASDLKQIVEAFELVEENGGLKEALEFLRYAPVMHPEVWKLQDAITLVEQCL